MTRHVENFLVGAMDVDSGAAFFRRTPNKAVITGAHRSTSARALEPRPNASSSRGLRRTRPCSQAPRPARPSSRPDDTFTASIDRDAHGQDRHSRPEEGRTGAADLDAGFDCSASECLKASLALPRSCGDKDDMDRSAIQQLLHEQRSYFASGVTKDPSFRIGQCRLRQAVVCTSRRSSTRSGRTGQARIRGLRGRDRIVLNEIVPRAEDLLRWSRPRRLRTPLAPLPRPVLRPSEPSVWAGHRPWNFPVS